MNLFITPHPPIILEEIGRGEEKKAQATIDGMNKVAEEIARIKPKTIAFVTPHWQCVLRRAVHKHGGKA